MAESQRKGKRGESIATKELIRIGVLMLQPITTPFAILGTKVIHGVPYQRVVRTGKVYGDVQGHRSDGIHVLAEVKCTTGGNLTWSLLKKHGEHQATSLDRHAEHAIALVVWVRDTDPYVLRWPILGFGHGRAGSITPEKAAKLHITNIDHEL